MGSVEFLTSNSILLITGLVILLFVVLVFYLIKNRELKRTLSQIEIIKDKFKEDISLSQYSIDHSADFIFWVNRYGDIIYSNNIVQNTLGFTKEELEDLKIHYLLKDITAEQWRNYWQRLKDENAFIFESSLINKKDKEIPVEISVNYFIYEGVEFNFIFARDITKRKEAEQQLVEAKEAAESSEKLKSAFLANMSHEIRTPMTALVGFSNLLFDSDLSVNQKKEIISHIKTNSEVLLNLVDDIIDLSLIEAGDLHISKTWHNLNDILRSVYVYHKKKKGIYSSGEVKFHMRINERLNTLNIYTDSIRFRQIFNYLIKNAFKFTYQGYIEFGYQIKKDNLVFYVKDSGIGIPKERHNEIFKVFRKFDVEESKIYQGTGLGLSIAKKLVNLLDGEIWVESEPGKGSVFYFSVPVENINVGETKTVKREVEKDWNDKTILVVDDLDYNYELIVTALKRTKANLLRASDGNEAVEICKKNNNIDLILMDIRMPVMDGYEATREIKKINDHIPIIAQTAYAMFEEREKSLMVGCNDYITKPISKKFLLEVIDKYL